ncbi:MAG: trehalose-phosphatase [Ramlibacter sp.]
MSLADILCPSCALFLDFDGTLVDLAPQPEDVVVPSGLVRTLQALQQYLGGAVAVISGRPIDQIDAFLAPLQLPAAGVHGAERRGPDGEVTLLSTHSLRTVEAAATVLALKHPALRVENKRGSIALHYRQAPELQAMCLETMQAAVEQSPGLSLLHGKMVLEAKPSSVSKGLAIQAFLREAPFIGRTPLFVGDDVTDEAGFTTVQNMGGTGVKVGPGPTCAWQRLASPEAMRLELEQAVAVRTRRDTA